jgi:hypothetical protein
MPEFDQILDQRLFLQCKPVKETRTRTLDVFDRRHTVQL